MGEQVTLDLAERARIELYIGNDGFFFAILHFALGVIALRLRIEIAWGFHHEKLRSIGYFM